MAGRRRGVALMLLAAVLAAACGARLDEEQLAAVSGQQPGAVGPGAVTGGRSPGGTVAAPGGTAPPGGGPAPSGGAAPAPGAEGAPAPGDGGGGGGGGAAACAPEGSSDVGVTPDSIAFGQVSTISGPIPGLGQTVVNGARAYAAYRNAQGGICGREMVIESADDRLDTGQNRAEHARLAERVFGFVGGWSVVDDGGASVLEGTNIPDVTISITDARASLPNNFSSNPIALDGGSGLVPILEHLRATYGPTSAAVIWGAQSTSRNRAQGFIRDLNAMGMQVVVEREVAITETNYVPVAQDIENRGAELVLTTLEMNGIARLAQAFQQIGYQPTVPYYGAQSYGDQLIELAGSAAEGTILGLTHPIVEEAGGGGMLDTFVEWYERVNPGQPIDFFSFQGWVGADMMADAVEAAGPSPTRDAVLGVLQGFTSFDADGLVAPFNPAGKVGSPCFLIVAVRDGRWVREHPQGGGFDCP